MKLRAFIDALEAVPNKELEVMLASRGDAWNHDEYEPMESMTIKDGWLVIR